MRDSPSFNLIEQPWIRVHRLDGRVDEVSIMGLFESAHESRAIVGEVPTQTFAILRVLLAILHRAVEGPRDTSEWHGLWCAHGLPTGAIAEYLETFRERFDLLHPRTPFYQVADLRTAKDEVFGLERLIADVPSGEPYFTTRLKSGLERLSFAEAARWLVNCQAFDPSGIKSGAVGDPRVQKGKGYPIGTGWAGRLGGVFAEGGTLRETLLLNLIADESDYVRFCDADLPAWERLPDTELADETGMRPLGPLDLYTWQSRRIRLSTDSSGVSGVLIANGDRIERQNRHSIEPMCAWRRSEGQEKRLKGGPVYMPLTHDPERLVWRGLSALLPNVTGQKMHMDSAHTLPPAVLEWIGKLRVEGCLPDDYSVRIRLIAMAYVSKETKTSEIVDDALSLSVSLMEEASVELGAVAVGAVEDADQGARALGNLAANLAEAAGDKGTGARSHAREAAFSALDRPFREWLSALSPHGDPIDARGVWQKVARRIVLELGRGLLEQSGPASWIGREVRGRHVSSAAADLWFRREVARAFELAAQPEKGGVAA
ncbi:MAG: type I-E CRISPR-associated protein Cse1/CasA [Coriobacteriia bacterium]|nr:type I-E CRISPR-associated protein Cse1/CasA [Coriobacteriia bacterium]